MNKFFNESAEGIRQGLREAPREFVVPFVLIWRGLKKLNRVLEAELEEARASANRNHSRTQK